MAERSNVIDMTARLPARPARPVPAVHPAELQACNEAFARALAEAASSLPDPLIDLFIG